jgi:phospholipase A1/A2
MSRIKRTLLLSIVPFTFFAAMAAHAGAPADTPQVLTQSASGTQEGTVDKECNKTSPISTYKINYFSLNSFPNNKNAQVKFQFSAKYKFFNRDIFIFKRPLSLYLAYSQKSLWNVGQESMPFEESNYNPEAFFDYQADISQGFVALRHIILSPYEHESNGLAGPMSRGWNRLYAAVRLGFFPIEEKCDFDSTPKDRIELFLKAWHAYGYSDETAYLQTINSNKTFLGYEGYGEVSLLFRDIIVHGDDWGNSFEITSRIGGKENIELQYVQKMPTLNFSPYVQYWHGYDETLLRFDRFVDRTFVGVSFVY